MQNVFCSLEGMYSSETVSKIVVWSFTVFVLTMRKLWAYLHRGYSSNHETCDTCAVDFRIWTHVIASNQIWITA